MCVFILAVCCEPQRRKLRRLHGKPEISLMFPQFYEVFPCMGFATRTHRGLESSPPSKEKNDHIAIVNDMNKPGLANESWGLLLSGVKAQRQYKVVARHVPYLVYALELVSGRSVVLFLQRAGSDLSCAFLLREAAVPVGQDCPPPRPRAFSFLAVGSCAPMKDAGFTLFLHAVGRHLVSDATSH